MTDVVAVTVPMCADLERLFALIVEGVGIALVRSCCHFTNGARGTASTSTATSGTLAAADVRGIAKRLCKRMS